LKYAHIFSFFGKFIPKTLWDVDILHLPESLTKAHTEFLNEKGWIELYSPSTPGSIGGSSYDDAKSHVINRFLNSAARMQYVCADPRDEQPDIRKMVLDQLGDGHIFLLDIAAGNGAGTLAMLSLICELRAHSTVPKLPLNVSILGVDYSADALNFYAELQDKIKPRLEEHGINIELNLSVCDLTIIGEFSEVLESFFMDAKKKNIKRFLCLISAINGIGKDGIEQIHDSLKFAAAGLSHSKRNSSWLWVEPNSDKSWPIVIADSIKHTLQKVKYKFSKKGESFQIQSDIPLLENPDTRTFNWHDPHKASTTKSRVYVMAFKNK
jgi:hypothetical protein